MPEGILHRGDRRPLVHPDAERRQLAVIGQVQQALLLRRVHAADHRVGLAAFLRGARRGVKPLAVLADVEGETLALRHIAPGNKAVYVRITAPDGYVLTTEAMPTFEFEGERLSYSAMREVDYQNQDLSLIHISGVLRRRGLGGRPVPVLFDQLHQQMCIRDRPATARCRASAGGGC